MYRLSSKHIYVSAAAASPPFSPSHGQRLLVGSLAAAVAAATLCISQVRNFYFISSLALPWYPPQAFSRVSLSAAHECHAASLPNEVGAVIHRLLKLLSRTFILTGGTLDALRLELTSACVLWRQEPPASCFLAAFKRGLVTHSGSFSSCRSTYFSDVKFSQDLLPGAYAWCSFGLVCPLLSS